MCRIVDSKIVNSIVDNAIVFQTYEQLLVKFLMMYHLPSVYMVVMQWKNVSFVKTVQAALCFYVNGVRILAQVFTYVNVSETFSSLQDI